ncbi:Gfo/Idh/MocA family oxidoreductase [Loktanella sp. F6476L]|nr:Gfo/Idh/MocA family oxidoreductase [Loktanella sp. F6476L]
MNIVPVVLGRGAASAEKFAAETGIRAQPGVLAEQLADIPTDLAAIVTVNAHALAEVTGQLIDHGIKRILVEKPAALDVIEMSDLLVKAKAVNAEVYVAYNRRFLSSVIAADRIISEDGGLVSLRFDFSEPARRIGALGKHPRELNTWFYGNSTHVIDLAFHFFGAPEVLEARIAGQNGVDWHPDAGVFVGFGHRADQATIAWHANWISPGRWGMEILTKERRLILQPLEKLRMQTHDSFAEVEFTLDDKNDQHFKPGILRQTRAFLTGEDKDRLVTLENHAMNMKFYEAIRTGQSFGKTGT